MRAHLDSDKGGQFPRARDTGNNGAPVHPPGLSNMRICYFSKWCGLEVNLFYKSPEEGWPVLSIKIITKQI